MLIKIKRERAKNCSFLNGSLRLILIKPIITMLTTILTLYRLVFLVNMFNVCIFAI